MTKQEIFDKVAVHLLTQKEPSLDEKGDCMYRGADGSAMCAVGCLIPDELYSDEMEDVRVRQSTRVQEALSFVGIDTQDEAVLSLLDELQLIHDGIQPRYWESRLISLASDYSLSSDSVSTKNWDTP